MANSKSNKKNNSNPPNKSLNPPKLIENFLNEFTKQLKEVYHYEKSSESKDIPPLTMNLERDLVSPINKLKNYSRTDTPLPNLPIPYKENIKNPKKLRQEPRSTAILINNNQQHQITRSEEDLIHDIELIDNVKKLEKNKSVSKKSKSRSGINQPVNWLDKFRKLLPYSRYTSYYFSSMPKILLSTTKILVELDNHLVCIQFPKFTDRIWEKIIEKLSIHLLYESQLFSNQFGKLNDQDSLPNNLLSCLIPSTLEELEIKCNCQPGFQSEKKYCIHFRSAWEGIANHFWAKPCDLFLVWGRSVEEIVTAIHKERKKILIESALNNSVTVQNNEQSEELLHPILIRPQCSPIQLCIRIIQ